jgi:tRNA-uridine 2-sulfurtransferase
MKAAVGMSGGVDSSVAALLLLRRGWEVVGLHMSVWDGGPAEESEAIRDARAVCECLGIPLHVFDLSAEYRELVLEDYRREYVAGRTPNPCVLCNPAIKFGLLVDKAREAGLPLDLFATGHYARIDRDAASGRHLLRKARDARKDQSYFLYRLSQAELARTVLPLGELVKTEVRRVALEAGLPVSSKADSQDFCCVDRRGLLGRPDTPGPIVDTSGRVLGRHRGIWHYTRGQRRGLGVAAGEPLYVVDIRARDGVVVLGSRAEACSIALVASSLAWIAAADLEAPRRLEVRIRSTHVGRPALVSPAGPDRVRVDFDEPELAVSPGQSAVFYDGDVLIGGGVIDEAIR